MEIKTDTTSAGAAPIALAEFPSWIQAKAQSEKNIFCIIDAAADTKLYPLLKNSNWEYRCLYKKGVHFKGERIIDALAATAPYLLLLNTAKMPVEHFIGERLGKHMLILFQSRASINELLEHFSGLLKAVDENGNLLNFRYYDPRILRVYLPTCTEEEKAIFCGPAEVFWAEDAEGGMFEFPPKIKAPSEKKSKEADEKKLEQPESGYGILSTAKKPSITHEESLTDFGIFGH